MGTRAKRAMKGTPRAGSGRARAAGGSLRGTAPRAAVAGLAMLALTLLTAAALPAAAGAEAAAAPPPTFSSAAGLPDGRVYEQVSPLNKYGHSVLVVLGEGTGLARADGNAVLYMGDGGLAESSANGSFFSIYVSERTSAGWSTRSALPQAARGLTTPEENNGIFVTDPRTLLPSADLSHLAFTTYKKAAYVGPPDRLGLDSNVYLAGPDPLAEEPVWIGRPQIAEPIEPQEIEEFELYPIGGAPDLSTLYFIYKGTLLGEDAAREPLSEGFYEYRDGVLGEAGVLPDGSLSPSGAAPAAIVKEKSFTNSYGNPDQLDNEVSLDGSRAFFVSVDPSLPGVTELYVRETAPDGTRRTVLVSRSELPGHVGDLAPHGPHAFDGTAPGVTDGKTVPGTENELAIYARQGGRSSYVYASPDGSHAFFQSVDQLTSDAPSDGSVKTYDFDVDTGALEYLPGVVGSPVASARDGSSLIFENTSTSPFELERWSAGPNGGSVGAIVKLPAAIQPNPEKEKELPDNYKAPHVCPLVCVGPTRLSEGGGVVVFETNSPIAGFNDGGYGQVFRYDSASNDLSCLSCPPPGVTPSGDALMSFIDRRMDDHGKIAGQVQMGVGNRGMSADGGQVFFDTPDPLAPQDVNGLRDVYEWDNGTVFLISSGTSPADSVFLDSGESGGDVFFATTSELVPGDNDGSYDVYDARIPRPGDNPPPSSVPCQGEVCQGPPSVPELLGAPASATFNGLGNLPPQSEPAQPAKAKAKAKKKKVKRRRPSKRKKGRKASTPSANAKRGKGRGK